MFLKRTEKNTTTRDELDLTQIAFSEQELMLKDRDHYRYDIVDMGSNQD